MVDFDSASYKDLVFRLGRDKPSFEALADVNVSPFMYPVQSEQNFLNLEFLPQAEKSVLTLDKIMGTTEGREVANQYVLPVTNPTIIEKFTNSFRLASIDFTVGSKHFSSDAEEIGYSEFNPGGGVTIEVGEDNGWSFTALMFQDSLKGLDEDKKHNPNSDNWSPVIVANYFFGITDKFKCGLSIGLTDYEGELPRIEFYKTISPAAFTSCVVNLTEKFAIQIGYIPSASINSVSDEALNEAAPENKVLRDPPHILMGLVKWSVN